MAVTERAVALREHAHRALTELDAMRAGAEQFDAASSQQTFRIGSPYLLVNTDLVFTTARHFAAHFVRLLPLAISPAPFDFPRMRFYQLWHERSQQSPPHRWFRGLLTEAARRSAFARDA